MGGEESMLDRLIHPLLGLEDVRAVADFINALKGIHMYIEHDRKLLLHVGCVKAARRRGI